MAAFDPTSAELVAQLQLRLRDFTNKSMFTSQVALAVLNMAVMQVFETVTPDAVGQNLYQRATSVSFAAGVASLPGDPETYRVVQVVVNKSGRPAHVVSVQEFDKRTMSNMTIGTRHFPIAGVDIANLNLYVSPTPDENDTVGVYYISRPPKLTIDGVLDETGSDPGADQNPTWPPPLSAAILERAVELSYQILRRMKMETDPTAEKMLAMLKPAVI